jgi:hypothetical protein
VILIKNAHIHTMHSRQPTAEALAIEGEKIVWVGEAVDAPLGASKVIDAHGATMLPGLIDSHFHLVGGAKSLDSVQLYTDRNIAELQANIARYAKSFPNKKWVKGRGWQYSAFADDTPIHRRYLDEALPDRPFIADAFDGHSTWVNTRALELAGILSNDAHDPHGFGKVVRDTDGLATGELLEPPAMDLVRDCVPKQTDDEVDALLQKAMQLCNRVGITSVQNKDSADGTTEALRRANKHGNLTLRVDLPKLIEPGMTTATIDEWVKEAHELGEWYAGDKLRCGGFKFFMDGVIESGTAFMLEPYADGSGSCGARNFEQGLFDELVTRCDANGGHVAVHAIGDGAVRATLDGFAAARAANGSRDSRHRIEHIEVLHPNDLNRFLSLGVIASVQPVHASFIYDLNNPWIRKVGAERLLHGMVWRKLLTHGVPLALGSDWPVASYDPRMGIHAAVTRGRFSQHADVRDQRLTLHETLYGFTVAGAYAEFQESVKGVLQPGYLADLILIDRDWFQCPPEQILDTRVFMTMLGGTIVYEE